MSSIFTLLVMVVMIYFLIKKYKATMDDNSKGGPNRRSGNFGASKKPGGYTNFRPHKDIISVTRDMGDSRNSSVLRDDKTNDWLARQLREEHRAFKATSEMFDLKIEHASHCDARLIEQFHRRTCDAEGIDLANGRAIHRQ